MKLAIMQPYFFPYLGYFALIAKTDRWVVFDVSQYKPRSWMNRNRILHPKQGWCYITLALANSSMNIKIHEARILNSVKTYQSMLGQISHYRKKAPFFLQVQAMLKTIFDQPYHSLVTMNIRVLQIICQYLQLPFHYAICSKMSLTLPETMPPGEWALTIARQLGAKEYINPIGGQHLFNAHDYVVEDIALSFLEMPNFSYLTRGYIFENNLSILDVLMWNDPKVICDVIHSASIIPAV